VSRVRAELRGLRRRLAERSAESDIWDAVQLARHQERPYTLDYVSRLFDDFVELHGDRVSGEDPAIVAGLGRFRGRPVAIVGHQKGRDLKERTFRNFGLARPEGYGKAVRIFGLADRLGLPVLTFVDTPGAHPGIESEQRGQAGAIARSMLAMLRLRVPSVTTVIGEGGSGGALAIAVADRVLMLQNSIYSVITPEGCAAILWKDAGKAEQAAEALKLTARDLLELKVIDEVIPEPLGGAHRDPEEMARRIQATVMRYLRGLQGLPVQELLDRRLEKFLKMGVYLEETGPTPPPSGG
jgi:acetyl-CoA carboxylase carboxyl transferase subunit alpha